MWGLFYAIICVCIGCAAYHCAMIYLFLSIVASTAIYLLFKWFEKLGVRIFPAIVVNYLTALAIGLLVVPDLKLAIAGASQWPAWTVGGLALGVVFISIFYLMAITAQKVGVSVTTIASKMSLALAVVLFVLTDPAEEMTAIKVAAIVLALAGVILSSMRNDGTKLHWKAMIWPLLILVGSTVIDFGIAHFSSMPQNESELSLYSCLSFGMAACAGMLMLIIQIAQGTAKVGIKDVLAGLLLGAVNYGSIFFLVMAYHSGIMPKSSLLPVNNLGVVLLGAIAAIVFFREKLTRFNWAGLGLSVIALVLLLEVF
jgi:drug/metabolite transporter (DMT)-like permease